MTLAPARAHCDKTRMKRNRSLTRAEIEIWRAVAETVPTRMPGAVLPARPETPKQGALGPVDPPKPTAPGWSPPPQRHPAQPVDVERGLRRKLASGRQPIEAKLDLHGFRQAEAHARLTSFVMQAHRDGRRLVLVVTGKGRGEGQSEARGLFEDRGVLRRLVPLWLAEPRLSPFVVAFGEAGRGHGGGGALYIHLRGRRPTRT